MTTRQRKWRTIAIAYEERHKFKSSMQHHLTQEGLCNALYILDGHNFGSKEFFNKMGDTLRRFWWPVRNEDFRYYGRFRRQCDYERATFAGFMAAISDNDYEEMIGANHA